MIRSLLFLLLALPIALQAAQVEAQVLQPDFWSGIRLAIERHLGRPYVWGGAGLKNFDCSGFVWRVMLENGILVKRTTARKFYMSLPSVPRTDRFKFGNIVFFDNLKHCGIVSDSATFYHAQLHKGTNLSEFDAFWRPKVCGFRKIPKTQP